MTGLSRHYHSLHFSQNFGSETWQSPILVRTPLRADPSIYLCMNTVSSLWTKVNSSFFYYSDISNQTCSQECCSGWANSNGDKTYRGVPTPPKKAGGNILYYYNVQCVFNILLKRTPRKLQAEVSIIFIKSTTNYKICYVYSF